MFAPRFHKTWAHNISILPLSAYTVTNQSFVFAKAAESLDSICGSTQAPPRKDELKHKNKGRFIYPPSTLTYWHILQWEAVVYVHYFQCVLQLHSGAEGNVTVQSMKA